METSALCDNKFKGRSFGKVKLKAIWFDFTSLSLISVNKEFEARAATTANTLQLTKNRVAEVGIKIGSVLLPHINSLLEKLNFEMEL